MAVRQSYYVGVKGIIKNSVGDVLILQDAGRGKWEVPGGRIDAGQSITESFSRELSEELPGSQLYELGKLVHAAQGDFFVENNHRLLLLFYIANVELSTDMEISGEHKGYDWVNLNNIDDFDIFTTDKAAIAAALEKN